METQILITKILALKDRVIACGFDWPTADIEMAPKAELDSFLEEITIFYLEN